MSQGPTQLYLCFFLLLMESFGKPICKTTLGLRRIYSQLYLSYHLSDDTDDDIQWEVSQCEPTAAIGTPARLVRLVTYYTSDCQGKAEKERIYCNGFVKTPKNYLYYNHC